MTNRNPPLPMVNRAHYDPGSLDAPSHHALTVGVKEAAAFANAALAKAENAEKMSAVFIAPQCESLCNILRKMVLNAPETVNELLLTGQQRSVYNTVARSVTPTAGEVATLLGISRHEARYILDSLVGKGYLCSRAYSQSNGNPVTRYEPAAL